jgi:hypothetical protein
MLYCFTPLMPLPVTLFRLDCMYSYVCIAMYNIHYSELRTTVSSTSTRVYILQLCLVYRSAFSQHHAVGSFSYTSTSRPGFHGLKSNRRDSIVSLVDWHLYLIVVPYLYALEQDHTSVITPRKVE